MLANFHYWYTARIIAYSTLVGCGLLAIATICEWDHPERKPRATTMLLVVLGLLFISAFAFGFTSKPGVS